MPVDVDRPKEHGRLFIAGFTPAQKALTVLAVVAVVIAGVTFMRWSAKSANIPAGGIASHAPGAVPTSGTDAQIAQTQAYDAALEQRIEDMVDSTLGPGHAAVTVAAQLDSSKRSSVTRNYDEVSPGATVPITQNDDHETLAPSASGGSTPTTVYEKTQIRHHNAVDSTVTNSDTPAGTLKRLSVSVLLDRAVVTPAQVASIWRPSILAAAGIDAKRDGNNALKVMTVAFSKHAQKQPAQLAGATTSNRLIDLVKQFLALLMLALVLFVAWHAMKRAERNRVVAREPLDLQELETTRPAAAGLDLAGGVARVDREAVPAPIEASVASIELEIADLIERQPDEVAQTLRSWLADRRA